MEKFIAIDGGNNIGIAIYKNRELHVSTLYNLYHFYKMMDKELDTKDNVIVIIEDVTLIKTNFHNSNNKNILDRISRNVGMVMQRTKDIIDYFKMKNVDVMTIKPTKSKLDSEQIKLYIGIDIKTNSHERDAMMLLFRNSIVRINNIDVIIKNNKKYKL